MAKSKLAAKNGYPLNELHDQVRSLVDQVRTSGSPMVLTDEGRPAAVLAPAEEYALQQRRLALLEHIAEGEADIASGRVHAQEEIDAIVDRLFDDP